MNHNDKFRKVVKEKFKEDIKDIYLPDQTYINRLIASLDKAESNSYSQCYNSFISEYEYLKRSGFLLSIKSFTEGCLNQLLWINTILESGMYASTEEELEEMFDYVTPIMLGNPWILGKVTKKGVCFRGEEPFQDSRVRINSENIIEITLALSKVTKLYSEHIAAKKSKPGKSVVVSSSKTKGSTLFKSLDLQNKCLNVLKEITNPVLDRDGHFINQTIMKGAINIWFKKCLVLGFISNEFKKIMTNSLVATEVMKIIPNLSIDRTTFSKTPKAIKFKADIERNLENISNF